MTELIKSLTDRIDSLLGGEIKELKFGCKIKTIAKVYDGVPDNDVIDGIIISYDAGGFNGEDYNGDHAMIYFPDWDCTQTFEDLNTEDKEDSEFIEIIGRNVWLDDVMRAIRKSKWGKGSLVDINGIFYTPDTLKPLNIGCAWIMGKPLSLQSEETLRSLVEIFNENE